MSLSKRLFDIFFATFFLILLAPACIVISLILLFEDGPVFFVQERVGLNGKVFKCLKFRSMVHDTSNSFVENQIQMDAIKNGKAVLVKLKEDSRITAIGSFLRSSSLDEVPQFINVLRGEMSIVGPRPLSNFLTEPYPEIRKHRTQVMPGITGLWQIRSRQNNTSVLDMVKDDNEYIEKQNFWYDFGILIKTPFSVIKGKGAY